MNIAIQKRFVFPFLLLSLSISLILAACGGSSAQTQKKASPTPTPTPAAVPSSPQGQALLQKVGKDLASARSLHGIFNLQITGQLLNGNLNSEIWNVSPDKNRTHVLTSTISQFPAGMVTVTNGKQAWQYDPTRKVVYTGPQPKNTTSSSSATQVGGQSQLVLGIIQTVFTRSKATTLTDNVMFEGANTSVIHVVSQNNTGAGSPTPTSTATPGTAGNFQYTGDVYINKATQKPIRIDLGINGVGQVVLGLPSLEVNRSLPDSLFTFVAPAGTKVLPLSQLNSTNSSGRIPFVEAQRQAGYHLLSIPGTQNTYELNGVSVLGSTGSQIFTLNYNQGNEVFTVVEGRSLANLPGKGSQVNLRGTTATFTSVNGTNTLSWTEKGVGIKVTGKLSQDQLTTIANLLT